MSRSQPNILITGTPGTGKTTTAELLASAAGLEHVNVGQLVKDEGLHSGWDERFQCHILDEDKVCDELEDKMGRGGCVVDHHGCDFFPERWFDLVVVLQADNSVLWERLEEREYPTHKIQENVQCEIMHVVVEEARESYREDVVQVLSSNTVDEMERNVSQLTEWVAAWRQNNA
ncbi:hypothetical protein H632_c294p1 [Helicosporidium sp. ATCC 50920]|nr:hypothetical protein H632_c294p1 [Helicosporidium sp. ATCC 50920]|eukprot:KDD76260.1 hypothetical protein H632_c294p1 [Helicosporidium sp. ATCC 50920]